MLSPFWVIAPYIGKVSFFGSQGPEMKTIYSPEYQRLLKWLRAVRREKGLTMREVGARLGLPHSWVGKIEIGERRLDVVEYLRLCQALQADPHEGLNRLLNETGKIAELLRAAEPRASYRSTRHGRAEKKVSP